MHGFLPLLERPDDLVLFSFLEQGAVSDRFLQVLHSRKDLNTIPNTKDLHFSFFDTADFDYW